MTPDEAARLLEQYRAGIDAELTLLRQLAAVAHDQHQVTSVSDFGAFNRVADRRDSIMQSLVTIEEGMRVMRQALTAHRDVAVSVPGYDAVLARHHEAADLVNMILATDQKSISALADAELARRSAMASLERGENTLAAYRRVLSPPVSSARLVDKIG
jgi:hypothetical protein